MKRRNIMVLMISLSLVLLLGSSYALLRSTAVGTTPYVINVGSLQVSFEGSTDKLSLENMYPMSDKEGSNQSKELGFVVKNTGDIEARYNVYLEETSTDPEFKNYIRFISNKNSEGYNEPKTMGYDKYIDLEARLGVSESASYKVKVWLDKEAENDYMDKTFTAKVVIEGNQIDTSNTLYTKMNNAIKEHSGTTIVEDNVTYLSGSSTDVNYNYVWYSGKLWRIVILYNDGTMKLVTEDPVTSIVWGANSNYETSWVREWLNNEFIDTLYNYQNIIETNYSWNATPMVEVGTPIPKTTMINDPVGLLNIYEFYKAYQNDNSKTGYLINFSKTFITPYSENKIWMTYSNANSLDLRDNNAAGSWGTFPSIVLKKDVIVNGNGSIEKPYEIVGDIPNTENNYPLNSRISGEYVNFDNQKFRIIDINNNLTKLKSVNYLKDSNGSVMSKSLSNSAKFGNGTSEEYWDYYLNNIWYNSINDNFKNMMLKDVYYLGEVQYNDYKNTICKDSNTKENTKQCEKNDSIWEGYVGLSRMGEMFSNQLLDRKQSNYSWLLTPYDESKVYMLTDYSSAPEYPFTNKYAASPTITLSNKVLITSGEGTYDSPYEISCPNCNNT